MCSGRWTQCCGHCVKQLIHLWAEGTRECYSPQKTLSAGIKLCPTYTDWQTRKHTNKVTVMMITSSGSLPPSPWTLHYNTFLVEHRQLFPHPVCVAWKDSHNLIWSTFIKLPTTFILILLLLFFFLESGTATTKYFNLKASQTNTHRLWKKKKAA